MLTTILRKTKNVGPKSAKNIKETEGSFFDTMNNPLKGSFFLKTYHCT